MYPAPHQSVIGPIYLVISGSQSQPTTTVPRIAKKWRIFQNFFGEDSDKYVRHSSSLGKILY